MLNNYIVKLRITNKMRKPAGLEHTKTSERFSWIEEITAREFDSESKAEIAAMIQLTKYYSAKQYEIDIVETQKVFTQNGGIVQ